MMSTHASYECQSEKGVILPFSHTPTISIIQHPSGVLSVDNGLATHVTHTQLVKGFGERKKKEDATHTKKEKQ